MTMQMALYTMVSRHIPKLPYNILPVINDLSVVKKQQYRLKAKCLKA